VITPSWHSQGHITIFYYELQTVTLAVCIWNRPTHKCDTVHKQSMFVPGFEFRDRDWGVELQPLQLCGPTVQSYNFCAMYSVSQKSSPPPKTFSDIFTYGEPV